MMKALRVVLLVLLWAISSVAEMTPNRLLDSNSVQGPISNKTFDETNEFRGVFTGQSIPGSALAVPYGGTGATTAATARSNLSTATTGSCSGGEFIQSLTATTVGCASPATAGSFATLTGAESLTNKTLPSPTITGTVSGGASYTSITATSPTITSPNLQLAAYTKAGLPAAGTAGRLARVTDDVRGVWMDNGTTWNPLDRGITNVREFGAKGDGTPAGGGTDDYAAIVAAYTATPVGGTLYFPPADPGKCYRLSDTFTVSKVIHIQGSGWQFSGGTLEGSILCQNGGATKDVLKLDGSMAELDGILVENMVFGGSANSRYAIEIAGTSPFGLNRSMIRNVLLAGAGTAGMHTGNALVILSEFDRVMMSMGFTSPLGYAIPSIGFDLGASTGPNTWISCMASGVTTGTGYGWYLNGASQNTFIAPSSEGDKYAWFFAGAAGGNQIISPYHEASITAPVGGSTTVASNVSYGDNIMSLNLSLAGVGASIITGANGIYQSRTGFVGTNGGADLASPFTTQQGTFHAYRSGVTNTFTADVEGGVPIFGHTDSNVNDVMLLQLAATGALADTRIQIGAYGSKNLGDGGMKCYRRSTGAVRNCNVIQLAIDVIATGSLPAAGATRDGLILIEDAGAGNRNLIIYAGGERFRIDGGAPF